MQTNHDPIAHPLDVLAHPPMRLVMWGTSTIADVWPAETTELIRADGWRGAWQTELDDEARIAS
jgi:hypothetical protein